MGFFGTFTSGAFAGMTFYAVASDSENGGWLFFAATMAALPAFAVTKYPS